MITLKKGDKAPEFSGKDQDGNVISLKHYKGKKLVLYLFPEAGSPTCTIESCSLRDHYEEFLSKGYEVVGLSPDTATAQQKFREKHKLPFRLISDHDQSILKLFGGWDQKKLFGREYMGVLRTTFVINEEGFITNIFLKPKNKTHAQEILATP